MKMFYAIFITVALVVIVGSIRYTKENADEAKELMYAKKKLKNVKGMTVGDHISFDIQNYVPCNIKAYGERYESLEEVIEKGDLIPRRHIKQLEFLLDGILNIQRIVSLEMPKKYRIINTSYEGPVYIYKECKTTVGGEGVEHKVAINIVKDKDGSFYIKNGYLADENILFAHAVTEFDLEDEDQVELFKRDVLTNPEYEDEAVMIIEIHSRLEQYNKMLKDNRFLFDENGKILAIQPPFKDGKMVPLPKKINGIKSAHSFI